jgi:glutaredoxin
MRATLIGGLLVLLLVAAVLDDRGREQLLSLLPAPAARSADTAAAPTPAPVEESVPPAARADPDATATQPGAPAVLAAGELSVLEPEVPNPMVRYVDAQGSVRMVRGMANVPAEFRSSAVVLGRAHVNLLNVPAPSTTAFQDWQPGPNRNRDDVVLFSAPWCGVCDRAKRYLDRNGIRYEERDIDADDDAKQELVRIIGRIAVPLLQVDGRYVSGFRSEVYERVLRDR